MCPRLLRHCNIWESLPRVAQAYVNQRKLDHEVKTLQVQASQFAKQTAQWISMVENFNQALKVHRLIHIAILIFHNLVLQSVSLKWNLQVSWPIIPLQEIGDVENWARSIEMDMRTIATALEYVHKGPVQPASSWVDGLWWSKMDWNSEAFPPSVGETWTLLFETFVSHLF